MEAMEAREASAASRDKMFLIPWSSLRCENFSGLLKQIVTPTSITVVATDFRYLYLDHLDESALQDRCKELNPDIEVTTESLVKHVSEGLTAAIEGNTKKAPELTAITASDSLILCLSMSIGDVNFNWKFTMAAQSNSAFYSQVTLQMLVMLATLQEQKERLFAFLHKKDAEIAEYKASGARTTKKQLRTSPFDEDEFKHQTVCAGVLKERLINLPTSAFAAEDIGLMMKIYQEVSSSKHQTTNAAGGKLSPPCEAGEAKAVPEAKPHNNQSSRGKASSPEVITEEPKPKKPKKRLKL
ncbi:non-homologous end-joining factor 1-like [Haemaphysalis longicornis]